jgi:O-antigen ligase/polysaccharide polymerase Wzy-like membrane protein
MRRAVLGLAVALLLVGPAVLAFFSGGYFDLARSWAAVAAWALVLVAAVLSPRPLPRSAAGRVALGGLALMTAWTAASFAWAPLSGAVVDDVQRLLLYLGVLVAAAALLPEPRAAAAVEPALAGGALVVSGYGLAGRLLPGVVEQTHSPRAGARLDQPLTYWNAQGALAAMGLVLCAHLAADRTRPVWMRALSAAGCAPLGAAVYLSFSRGAIAAAIVGLVVLLALAPTWGQLRAIATAVAAAVAAAVCCAVSPAVDGLRGVASAREREGAIVLAALALVMAVAALVTARAERRTGRAARSGPLPGARRLPLVAAVVCLLAFAGVVVGGLAERGNGSARADLQSAGRLTTLQSNRYEYWRVGVDAFAHHPLRGLGAGGFRVAWLQERRIAEGVRDVHSLELEMAAELGLVGIASLLLLVGGVAASARAAVARDGALVAGWCAALMVWLVHATIDWDWEMPGVTLPAVVLAGALIAAAEREAPRDAPAREPAEAADAPAGAGAGAGAVSPGGAAAGSVA